MSSTATGKRVALAAVAGAHGIKGELRLKLFADSAESLARHSHLYVGGRELALKDIKDAGKTAIARFTRTLGTLIASGVPILDGLEITAKTAGNRVIHDAVMESRQSIAGGETIAAPLEKSKVFPPMVISMIAVGEQTGGLDEMLSKIADFYEEEVDVAVAGVGLPPSCSNSPSSPSTAP